MARGRPHSPVAKPAGEPASGAKRVRWNLSAIYSEAAEKGITRDVKHARRQVQRFAAAYEGRISSLDASELRAALEDLERIQETMRRPSAYAFLNSSTNVTDAARTALQQRVQDQLGPLESELAFFEAEWTAMSDDAADRLLEQPQLANYQYFLRCLRRYRPYLMSSTEERVLDEKSLTARDAWERLFEESLARIDVRWNGQIVSFAQAQGHLRSGARTTRRRAGKAITRALRKDLPLRAYVLNTVVEDVAINNRLHRYPTWRTERNLENDVSDCVVDNLIKSVRDRRDIPHRYYRLKARLLGREPLDEWDRVAPFRGDEPTVTWAAARVVVLRAYSQFSATLQAIADDFFANRWIDAAPAPRKQRWTYAHPVVPRLHPYVLVNYQGRLSDVVELAHELGHGVHMVMARHHTLVNYEPHIIVGEVAATLSETLVLRHLLSEARTSTEQLAILLGHIERLIDHVFRRVAMLEFEDAIHSHRRDHGELDEVDLERAWLTTQARVYGPAVKLGRDYAPWWSAIVQFVREPAYGYAYAFGNLVALTIYSRWLNEGPSFVQHCEELLTAGGSRQPAALLASVGINLADPGCWRSGLDVASHLVDDAEGLAREIRTAS